MNPEHRISELELKLEKAEKLLRELEQNPGYDPERRHYEGKIAFMMRDYFQAKLTVTKIEAEIERNPALHELKRHVA